MKSDDDQKFGFDDEEIQRNEAFVDLDRIERAVHEILLAIGEDPEREGLIETPKRVARMYDELFSGLHVNVLDVIKVFHEKDNDEMILVGDIPFYSMCEHHLLYIFRGTAGLSVSAKSPVSLT